VRYLAVMEACAHLFRQGIAVYSPILHWHQCAIMHKLPHHAEPWEVQNFDLLHKADEVAILQIEGWEESKGLRSEFDKAQEWCKFITAWTMKSGVVVCQGSLKEWPSTS
jgi:hypothetical protein